ncbi:coiled-coil domain-containing protein 159 isoform X1 [Tiliqua scincoides]|uniref:coiled-coil domain-containing protein 159 isoform X1 n=1 Tax=Tiliqua scincoides TaxID=71010 RepID=UPI0034630468
MFEGLMQRKMQEVWRAMTKEVEGLQSSINQKENSMENLSHEFLESKKFLWEELEAVQGELRCIHQKLSQLSTLCETPSPAAASGVTRGGFREAKAG